jgi:hypothetical protein
VFIEPQQQQRDRCLDKGAAPAVPDRRMMKVASGIGDKGRKRNSQANSAAAEATINCDSKR